jgi:UDP-2-acetamido-3-amino-2,3-dideoxy-glucuronate N-acetyltransferase
MEKDMNKKIAVIGCGYWGKNLVRNFYELNVLHTICDLEPKRVESLKKKYQDISESYDYKNLLTNPEIQAVAIATPVISHYKIAKEALCSNKDVFVEKPLAMNYEEGEELVALARERERILMVGHILEYHPITVKLKEMVKSGEFGNMKYIYSNRLNLGKFRKEENILWSFAPHDISIILSLLEETPTHVSAHGGNYLDANIADVTVTSLDFPSGVRAHIFVSWLHPYKEQKLVVIGGKKMALIDNVNSQGKIYLYDHKIDWIDRIPIPRPEDAEVLEVAGAEPLRLECEHFLECITLRKRPVTDGLNGLRVLRVLDACQESLKNGGSICSLNEKRTPEFFVHGSSIVDENVEIGEKTKIWHFSHILKDTKIGKNCSLGQNVVAGPHVVIGHNVKIQNNVSIYEGVTLEDDVFCGPSMVFTNVINPRSHWPRKDEYKKTLVRKGASLGANSTVLCGVTVGQYAFVGAGALVSRDVPDYALVYGNPAKIHGWMCYCGVKLNLANDAESVKETQCDICGRKYKKNKNSVSEI